VLYLQAEARIKRKMELQKANYSLAAIREHISKHDELMQNHKKQFEEVSPLRRLRQRRRRQKNTDTEDLAVPEFPSIVDSGRLVADDRTADDTSVDTTKSFITQGGKRTKKGKRLKTKLNDKIKSELVIEKLLRSQDKLELQERIKKKEKFSENVKKHKMPSPRRLPSLGVQHDLPSLGVNAADSLIKSPSHVSSITAVRVIDEVGSLVVSQLQVSPRIPHMSPRASASDLMKGSPRQLLNSNSSFGAHMSIQEPNVTSSSRDPHVLVDRPEPSPGQRPFTKYEYPPDLEPASSISPGIKPTLSNEDIFSTSTPYQRSEWVTQLLAEDPEEGNLAEVYEAGFSMYLAEKGIEIGK
jgi:hypothetical protein